MTEIEEDARKLINTQEKEIERLNQINDLYLKLIEKYQESVELYRKNFEKLKLLYLG